MTTKELELKSKWLRKQVLEKVISTKGKGHIGSTYSCVELLVALYYGRLLNFNSKSPRCEDRDRLIIGKGHVCYAVYEILADLGFFDVSLLNEYGEEGGFFGVQMNINTPGVEYNTGSLGNAIGIGSGIALSAKLDNKNFKTIVMVGDGECQEDSIWESLVFAGNNKLNNLTVIVDKNRLGVTSEVTDVGNLQDRAISCGWDSHVIDGHSFSDIFDVFRYSYKELPNFVIANTVKGKGISFMENNKKWHNSPISEEEAIIARQELQ